MYGNGGEKIDLSYQTRSFSGSYKTSWEGFVVNLQRRYSQTSSDGVKYDIERYMRTAPCTVCGGKRLKKEALSVYLGGKNIWDLCEMSVEKLYEFVDNLSLTETEHMIADAIVKEIKNRIGFLRNVGLNYLTLARTANTLSGGESQRIRLATQIGSALTGVLYILDEPSIGLHQRDNEKLLRSLKGLRDLGNTLIVVEHDEDTMRRIISWISGRRRASTAAKWWLAARRRTSWPSPVRLRGTTLRDGGKSTSPRFVRRPTAGG